MKTLLQRVKHANVVVNGEIISQIGPGLLVFVAIERDDVEQQVSKMAKRILKYRIFPDENAHMNISVKEALGEVLIVSQFTLAADTQKGLRPGFSMAAKPPLGEQLYDLFVRTLKADYPECVATGIYGADMAVNLCNDGPVTIWLQS